MAEETSPADSERRRGRRRSARSHEAVLAATIAMIGETGYIDLTLEAIATRAGVSRATIYRWWPSKASLVIDALDKVIPKSGAVSTGDTRADVRAVIQATLDHYILTPFGPNLAVLASDAVGDPEATARLVDLFGPRRAADGSVLLAAAGRGDLPHNVDVNLVLDIVLGTLIFRELVGVRPDDRIVDQLTDLIVGGKPPRTPPRSDN
ncbi:MAG: TetR/AcrR family transcriptional regulator [Kibdelosporangium sp.]